MFIQGIHDTKIKIIEQLIKELQNVTPLLVVIPFLFLYHTWILGLLTFFASLRTLFYS